jgi:DNA-binding NarL/FixJ family response regulator
MSYKTLLIVEDSDVIRARIRSAVTAIPGIEVVAEASDAAGAIEQVERHRPDFITLDLQLENGSTGVEVLKYLNDRSLSPVVIVLSANVDAFGTESTLLPGVRFVLDKVMEFHQLPRILMNEVRACIATVARPDDGSILLSKRNGTS